MKQVRERNGVWVWLKRPVRDGFGNKTGHYGTWVVGIGGKGIADGNLVTVHRRDGSTVHVMARQQIDEHQPLYSWRPITEGDLSRFTAEQIDKIRECAKKFQKSTD